MASPAWANKPKTKLLPLKIGLFGGTFDPIHIAHLIIPQYVLEELGLEKVIFIPSGVPPHKDVHLDAPRRLEMVCQAIADNERFECSDLEIKRKGITYSVDTIAALRDQLKILREDLYWIIGSDNLFTFHKWKAPDKILEMCRLVVFPRRADDLSRVSKALREEYIYLEDAPLIEISSTGVRHFIRNGRSIHYLVPDTVEAFIQSQNLYRS